MNAHITHEDLIMQTMPLPSEYIQPVDDGLPMRISGNWVAEKLFYVERYLNIFSNSMHKKPWSYKRYFDLFCGPGKCVTRETGCIYQGSPLLAVALKHPFSEYIYIDADISNIQTLNSRIDCAKVSHKINYQVGDSNLLIKPIIDYYAQEDEVAKTHHQWSSINTAFLDPEGLELEWTTIEQLASLGAMDLIINYSQSGITRNIETCFESNGDTILDKFFGDRQWRQIFGKQRARLHNVSQIHSQLIDHYRNNLIALGYVNVNSFNVSSPLMTNQTNAPLYRLLYASKDELGHYFWEEVTKKTYSGQRRFL
jgi:three-Cys-motif partner protein